MKIRRTIAAVAISAAALAGTAGVAQAHSFGAQGPPHTHTACLVVGFNSHNQCWRWILENGAIRQGAYDNLVGELPLVGVVCSMADPDTWPYDPGNYGEGWSVMPYVVGEWNSNGYHTYCQNPKYPTPVGLAGWSVNN